MPTCNFFGTGYINSNQDKSPGGLTLVMFGPRGYLVAQSKHATQEAIKSQFGNAKLDNNSVEFYAKNEYIITTNTNNLEDQFHTAIDALDLLTGQPSITSNLHQHVYKLIQCNHCTFDDYFRHNLLFGAKISYLVDKIFNNFCKKLASYHQ